MRKFQNVYKNYNVKPCLFILYIKYKMNFTNSRDNCNKSGSCPKGGVKIYNTNNSILIIYYPYLPGTINIQWLCYF